MAKVLMAIIVNYRLHLIVWLQFWLGVWLQETGPDSRLHFYCLSCYLLTVHVIVIQKC